MDATRGIDRGGPVRWGGLAAAGAVAAGTPLMDVIGPETQGGHQGVGRRRVG